MRHLPINNSPQELIRVVNRIWDAIETGGSLATANTKTKTSVAMSSGGGSVGSVSSGSAGTPGLDGAAGATGPTGDPGLALVGSRNDWEVLVDSDGGILTDENGYALMGVNSSNEVLCGVDGNMISVLGV